MCGCIRTLHIYLMSLVFHQYDLFVNFRLLLRYDRVQEQGARFTLGQLFEVALLVDILWDWSCVPGRESRGIGKAGVKLLDAATEPRECSMLAVTSSISKDNSNFRLT
jgi:hypothetical protein